MTTSPQSVIDLDGIKGRAALLAKALGSPVAQQVGGTDVPALVARVEQLEAENLRLVLFIAGPVANMHGFIKGVSHNSPEPIKGALTECYDKFESARAALSPRTNP